MKKIDLGQTISILANIGVIIGIAFLAIEISQNNDLLVADARRARSAANEAAWIRIAENSDLADILLKDQHGEELSEIELYRLQAHWHAVLMNLGSTYSDLPPRELEVVIKRFRVFANSSASFRDTWSEGSALYDPTFVDLMNDGVFATRE